MSVRRNEIWGSETATAWWSRSEPLAETLFPFLSQRALEGREECAGVALVSCSTGVSSQSRPEEVYSQDHHKGSIDGKRLPRPVLPVCDAFRCCGAPCVALHWVALRSNIGLLRLRAVATLSSYCLTNPPGPPPPFPRVMLCCTTYFRKRFLGPTTTCHHADGVGLKVSFSLLPLLAHIPRPQPAGGLGERKGCVYQTFSRCLPLLFPGGSWEGGDARRQGVELFCLHCGVPFCTGRGGNNVTHAA